MLVCSKGFCLEDSHSFVSITISRYSARFVSSRIDEVTLIAVLLFQSNLRRLHDLFAQLQNVSKIIVFGKVCRHTRTENRANSCVLSVNGPCVQVERFVCKSNGEIR